MKTKILKPLLAMACLLSSINVSAYDFEVDGIYYDVVSISNLACEVVKKSSNYKYSGDVVIPAHVNYANRTFTVVGIDNEIFDGCYELTGITIPNTITWIDNNMFYDCKKLERVKIEDGDDILIMGANVNDQKGLFYYCPLTSLYVGRNLLYTANYSYEDTPFYEIKTLKDLTIGNSVTEIGPGAFSGCSGLTNVTIPNSVTKIGPGAFENCI